MNKNVFEMLKAFVNFRYNTYNTAKDNLILCVFMCAICLAPLLTVLKAKVLHPGFSIV